MIGTCINENVIKNMCNFKCDTCKYFVKNEELAKLSKIVNLNSGLENEIEEYNKYIENIKKVTEKVKEKQYLKTWEAIKAMEEGEKVRNFNWIENCYIEIKNNKIVSDLGKEYIISDRDIIYSKWEIYEEPKKEIPKEFEGLKYLLASINNMNCDKQNCDNCPLGVDKCGMLDDIFFDMKNNYNF